MTSALVHRDCNTHVYGWMWVPGKVKLNAIWKVFDL